MSMVGSRQACKSVTDLRRRQRTRRLGGGGGMSDSSRQLQGEEPVKTEGSGGIGPEPSLWPGAEGAPWRV